jgi:hypothetical protein
MRTARPVADQVAGVNREFLAITAHVALAAEDQIELFLVETVRVFPDRSAGRHPREIEKIARAREIGRSGDALRLDAATAVVRYDLVQAKPEKVASFEVQFCHGPTCLARFRLPAPTIATTVPRLDCHLWRRPKRDIENDPKLSKAISGTTCKKLPDTLCPREVDEEKEKYCASM